MEEMDLKRAIVVRPKTELVRSYYSKHRDMSGESFEAITARKEKLIRKYITPLNLLIVNIQNEILKRPGDKEFRLRMIDIAGQLIVVRNNLLKYYQLDQTIK